MKPKQVQRTTRPAQNCLVTPRRALIAALDDSLAARAQSAALWLADCRLCGPASFGHGRNVVCNKFYHINE